MCEYSKTEIDMHIDECKQCGGAFGQEGFFCPKGLLLAQKEKDQIEFYNRWGRK